MIRRFLFAVFVLGLFALVSRLVGRLARRRAPAASGRASVPPRFEGAMVRDRVCQTFLPRSRALALRSDGEEHFFCSPACRDRFLAAAASR